jgi:hypothetical protein
MRRDLYPRTVVPVTKFERGCFFSLISSVSIGESGRKDVDE